MIKNKKIVIVEDDPGSFDLIWRILSNEEYNNKLFPDKSLNPSFLTKIHSFSLNQSPEKIEILRKLITDFLGGEPDYIVLDWEICYGSNPRQGVVFRDYFLNSNFLNCVTLEISEYIGENKKESPKRFLYNKNLNGSSSKERSQNYFEIFSKHK